MSNPIRKENSNATTSFKPTEGGTGELDPGPFYQQVLEAIDQDIVPPMIKKLENYTDNIWKQSSKKIEDKLNGELKIQAEKLERRFKRNIEQSRLNIIEVLGIFVALFTFISVNINIFTKVEYLSAAIWFMFIMLVCLVVFVFLLHIVLHRDEKNTRIWVGIFITLCILIAGFIATDGLGIQINKSDLYELNELYEQRIEKVEEKNLELQERLGDLRLQFSKQQIIDEIQKK